MQTIKIYDNEGETIDRYTVVIDSDIYTMSDNPLSPAGINQYCGDMSNFPDNMDHCGKPVKFRELPKNIKKAIKERSGE